MSPPSDRPRIIGIAGGVGSGKSTVAREFEKLGCLVSDSDAEAREALTRPEVIEELVGWWGSGVLDADGRVDRSAVARIVFADNGERKRLEGLVHPLLALTRARLIDDARRTGIRAVVIDAPLLFEAGLNEDCDAVVFVECPLEERFARVSTSRGWDGPEQNRREKAQWGLDRKRSGSDYVVVNDGRADLEPQVRGVLDSILATDPPSDR